MFAVERMEPVGKTWETIYQEESIENATSFKDFFEKQLEFSGGKSYEWRIREMEVGEKVL